jgi:hypothetical protein
VKAHGVLRTRFRRTPATTSSRIDQRRVLGPCRADTERAGSEHA